MHEDARWDTLADCDLSVSSECREDDSEISHTLFGSAIKGKMSEREIARHSSFLFPVHSPLNHPLSLHELNETAPTNTH